MGEKSVAWIGTSWKMNKGLAEAREFVDGLRASRAGIQRFVIPPFTVLREVKALLNDTDVKVGAQTMHWSDQGAWTGEISPTMLTDCGLDMVELGHSERRIHFGETDDTVGRKTQAAVQHGLIPLICVGEALEDNASGRADNLLRIQVEAALGKLSEQEKSAPILFAYEPVWAIGEGGTPAAPEYADERQATIKRVASELTGRSLQCLYGGSVNAGNCEELIRCPHIDGLFVGRAAWDVGGYNAIIDKCAAVI